MEQLNFKKNMKLKRIYLPLLLNTVLLTGMPLLGQVQFKDVTEKAGLVEPLKGMMGHGAAWGDVTGNGYPDLFLGTFFRPEGLHLCGARPSCTS